MRALALAVLTLLCGLASGAHAQTDVKTSDEWQFRFTAYGWLTNLNGSATAHDKTVDINASVIDLLQKSDSLLAWDSYFEATNGRFGLYADFVWARLQIPYSATAYRNPIAGLQLSATANAAITQSLTIVEAGAVYELAKWPGGDASFTALDALAGARLWSMSSQIQLDVAANVDFSRARLDRFDRSRNIGVADSGTLTWVDPLVGLRLRHQFTPSQEVMVRGDIGGFGIPGSSLFSWQLAAIYSYAWQFSGYSLAAVGGYRALSTSIAFGSGQDGSGLNLVIHGPVIGFSVQF